MNEAALRERVEYLEAENAELKRQLRIGVSDETIQKMRKVLRIRPLACRILWVLMDGRPRSYDMLFHAIYADRVDPPDVKILHVMMVDVRRAVRDCGATVELMWGHGWQLSAESIAKIAAHIGIEVQP